MSDFLKALKGSNGGSDLEPCRAQVDKECKGGGEITRCAKIQSLSSWESGSAIKGWVEQKLLAPGHLVKTVSQPERLSQLHGPVSAPVFYLHQPE